MRVVSILESSQAWCSSGRCQQAADWAGLQHPHALTRMPPHLLLSLRLWLPLWIIFQTLIFLVVNRVIFRPSSDQQWMSNSNKISLSLNYEVHFAQSSHFINGENFLKVFNMTHMIFFFFLFHCVASAGSPELCSYFSGTKMNTNSEACNHFMILSGLCNLGSNIYWVLAA